MLGIGGLAVFAGKMILNHFLPSLLRENGICVVRTRKHKVTTDSDQKCQALTK